MRRKMSTVEEMLNVVAEPSVIRFAEGGVDDDLEFDLATWRRHSKIILQIVKIGNRLGFRKCLSHSGHASLLPNMV